MERRRSVGVIIFACLGFLIGLYNLVESLFKVEITQIFLGLVYIFLSYNLFRLRNLTFSLRLLLNLLFFLVLVFLLFLQLSPEFQHLQVLIIDQETPAIPDNPFQPE